MLRVVPRLDDLAVVTHDSLTQALYRPSFYLVVADAHEHLPGLVVVRSGLETNPHIPITTLPNHGGWKFVSLADHATLHVTVDPLGLVIGGIGVSYLANVDAVFTITRQPFESRSTAYDRAVV